MKVLAERFVLHMIPAETDAETKASTAQDINFGSLLRYECGLSLRQDHDACRQLQARRNCRKKTEEHHRFMKWMLVRVGTREASFPVRVGAEHMIVDEEVVVSESLGGLRVVSNRVRIVAEFNLRKDNTIFHTESHPKPQRHRGTGRNSLCPCVSVVLVIRHRKSFLTIES